MTEFHRWAISGAWVGPLIAAAVTVGAPGSWSSGQTADAARGRPRGLEVVRVDEAGSGFVLAPSGRPFQAWGVNYDHDEGGRLLEDYWESEWDRVVGDFGEIRALGANLVRVHLQLGRFMAAPQEPDAANLEHLRRLVRLAEDLGLYLNITGLGCYRKADVPAWYEGLDEEARWAVQERFWTAVAGTCRGSPAVFCYDLMNEPVLPGAGKVETDWLAGAFGGFHFVQRIALDLGDRSRQEVARAWVARLAAAVRTADPRPMVTVGVIPWAHTFPGAKPIFYAPDVGAPLDLVSVHFYPRKGKVDDAITALRAYAVEGKPLIIEEAFPLHCSADELVTFFDRSRGTASGWVSFYWGKTPAEYEAGAGGLADAIKAAWIRRFAAEAKRFARPPPQGSE